MTAWQAVADAGYEPVLLAPESGEVQLFEHLDKAGTQQVDRTVSTAQVDDYDALVLPGGVANPDALRIGLSPLTTSFAELDLGLGAIRDELERSEGR